MSELKIGIRGQAEMIADADHTAAALVSGTLPVLATPAMIALLERAAWRSVQPYLEEGCSTVGIRVDVRHVSATPLGMAVRCETELTQIDGRRLTFQCRAFDEAGLIGEGIQERFVIKDGSFMDKAERKRG